MSQRRIEFIVSAVLVVILGLMAWQIVHSQSEIATANSRISKIATHSGIGTSDVVNVLVRDREAIQQLQSEVAQQQSTIQTLKTQSAGSSLGVSAFSLATQLNYTVGCFVQNENSGSSWGSFTC